MILSVLYVNTEPKISKNFKNFLNPENPCGDGVFYMPVSFEKVAKEAKNLTKG